MKQVFLTGKGVQVLDVPAPSPEAGHVLVQVTHSVISAGTESSAAKSVSGGVARLLAKPGAVGKALASVSEKGVVRTLEAARERANRIFPTGYSAAGVVLDGGGTGFARGDRVSCGGAGYANHAEVILVPKNLTVPVPEGMEMAHAAFAAIGAISMQGVRRAAPELGQTVVVAGLGLIGQLTVHMLLAMGCRVIALDLDDARVELAESFGPARCLNPAKVDAVSEIVSETETCGADSAIICAATGSSEPVNQAFRYVRKKGRIVIVGDVGMDLEREEFYRKEQDFLISCSYGPGRYDPRYEQKGMDYPVEYVRWTENRNMREFLRLVGEGKVRLERLITSRYPIGDAASAYAAVTDGRSLGVVLEYPGSFVLRQAQDGLRTARDRRIELPRKVTAKSGAVRAAVIGVGAIAREVHIPVLAGLPDCGIRAVVDIQPDVARTAGERCKADYCATDYREALSDPEVDAVFVLTRHDSHHSIARDAILAGKHVFVEKPLALTSAQCEELCRAAGEAGVLVAVGFNRRLSPLAIRAKLIADSRSRPKTLTYRVNAGPLPKDHWALDPEIGGGRIIGEGCHFFDFNAWLIGSPVTRVSAMAPGGDDAPPNDLLVTLGHADGSTSAVIYTCQGSPDLPKERIEFFASGCSFILEDWRALAVYGCSEGGMSLRRQDKGHAALLANFIEAVQGRSELAVTAADALAAAVVAEKALESAARGGEPCQCGN